MLKLVLIDRENLQAWFSYLIVIDILMEGNQVNPS
jgi:hypothetical protein